jgi:hypothetical protein
MSNVFDIDYSQWHTFRVCGRSDPLGLLVISGCLRILTLLYSGNIKKVVMSTCRETRKKCLGRVLYSVQAYFGI